MNTDIIAKLLIVDDEQAHMEALCNTLETEGYSAIGFTSPVAAIAALREQDFDLLLSDLMMPEMDGIELLRAALDIDPNLIGIVMTGQGTIDTAVQAMQAGALDYILKPFRLTSILPVIGRALAVRRLRTENVQLHEAMGIYKLSMAVASTLGSEAVLQKVAEAALLQSQVRAVSILLPTEDASDLCVAVARGQGAAGMEGLRVPFSTALSAWVDRHRQMLPLSQDLAGLRLASVAPLGDIPHSLSIPLLSGGKLVGILNFSAENPRRLIARDQGQALNILASAAASAIANASLIERLRAAEQRYRRLTENAPDMVFRYELYPQQRFSYVNPVAKSITGYSPEDYYDDADLAFKIAFAADRELMLRTLAGHLPGGSAVTLRCVHRNGNVIWLEQRNMLVRDQDGRLVAIEGIARDITERKLAEESIQRSLQEKDVMLNEIQHRVNNNLQFMSSLLHLQADKLKDPAARRMFADSQNRIQSIALVHQRLDVSSNFAEIDFSAYLRSLANQILASCGAAEGCFRVSIDAAGAVLALAEAVPCGLIVNELILDSLDRTPQGSCGNEIRIGFGTVNGTCTLTVDDGTQVDSPFGDDSDAVAVRLVRALTRQLGGTLETGREPKFRITFSRRLDRAPIPST
jgi:PAS domain S-box-containing protein